MSMIRNVVAEKDQARFGLGGVVCPAGALLITDAGLLNMWCHDRRPMMPEGILSSPEETATANDSVDFEITGPDAERAGVLLDRQWHPRFLFDMPRETQPQLARALEDIAKTHGLRAEIALLPERVSHRRRIDLAMERGHGAGELQFHGMWAVAIGDVPTRELRAYGERMPAGDPDEGRMRRVVLACRDTAVARSELVGCVMVDWARLMFVDVDAVGLWQDSESLDGSADFAFWGSDAERVARECGARSLDDETFGWVDMPVAEMEVLAASVLSQRDAHGLKLAADYRPHTHHYTLMEQIRASASASGEVTLGNARACGFSTSWGDGIFEVHRDLDGDGRLVNIRIELGTEKRQRLMRQVELRHFSSALVSKMVAEGGEPVRFMYREKPDREGDSGWRIFSAKESDAYNEDHRNIAIIRLADLADKRADKLLDEPVGSVFERKEGNDEFVRVTDWQPTED